MAFLRTIAQPDHPFAAPAKMIRDLFEGLFGNGGELPVLTVQQLPVEIELPGTKQKLTQNRLPPISIILLHQKTIPEIPRVPPIGKDVFGGIGPSEPRRVLIEVPRLSDQIQRNIRQGNILLQNGPIPRPFAVPMSQDQGIIRQMKRILNMCRITHLTYALIRQEDHRRSDDDRPYHSRVHTKKTPHPGWKHGYICSPPPRYSRLPSGVYR